MTDWSGIIVSETVAPLAPVNVNLWTPVAEDQKATVTRIRGELHVACFELTGTVGSFATNVFAGIQVVNRAQNAAGTERLPATTDDLEGGEWLWLRNWRLAWEVTGAAATPPNWYIPVGGDVLVGGSNPTVDVKAQRKLDLSQDELLLTLQVTGTNVDVAVTGMLRLLLKST